LHETTRLQLDSSPSLDEKSDRVCGDPMEKDARCCAAHHLEDFPMVKRAAIPAPSGHHPICGRNPIKPARSVSEISHLMAPGLAFLIRVASRNPMGVGFGFVNYFVFKNHFQ
jgi:hypothetical protein